MSQLEPLQVFVGEAQDLLDAVDEHILSLESASEDPETVAGLFRALHTLKGSSAAVGLQRLSDLAHRVEDVASDVRDGELTLGPELADSLLAATDILRVMVELANQGDLAMLTVDGYEAVMLALANGVLGESGQARFAVELVFDEALSEMSPEPLEALGELAKLGELHSVAVDCSALPPLDQLELDTAYVGFRVVLDTDVREAELFDALGLLTIGNMVSIERLRQVQAPREVASTPEAPPAGPGPKSPAAPKKPTHSAASSLRVSTEKLDALLNDVGELVQIVARAEDVLSREQAERSMRQGLLNRLQAVSRLLQETALDLRMVPLAPTFKGFERNVRDLSRQLGKQVRLELEGAATELDKTMIEKVADPLRHLVRNAVDHGIEDADGRARSGKPAGATVTLAARQQGGNVVIEVRDDGAGIDPEAIRAKAVRNGLLDEGAEVSRSQVLGFLFRPGFSTATEVTDVSGRGVGLDVVRENVESLGGSASIESELGVGTTFRLVIPLSMMIVNAIITRVGDERYSIPTSMIREQLHKPSSDLRGRNGAPELIDLRGEMLPAVYLAKLLGVPDAEEDPARSVVIVMEHVGQPYGLIVDEIESQQAIVIKSVERNYRQVPGFCGVTMLGTGYLSLVLDAGSIFEMAFASPPAMAVGGDTVSMHG